MKFVCTHVQVYKINDYNVNLLYFNCKDGVYFVLRLKQGNQVEVVFSKQCPGFKLSVAHLYPNTSLVPPRSNLLLSVSSNTTF